MRQIYVEFSILWKKNSPKVLIYFLRKLLNSCLTLWLENLKFWTSFAALPFRHLYNHIVDLKNIFLHSFKYLTYMGLEPWHSAGLEVQSLTSLPLRQGGKQGWILLSHNVLSNVRPKNHGSHLSPCTKVI